MSVEVFVRRRWSNEEFIIARGVSAKLAAISGLKYAGPVGSVAARRQATQHWRPREEINIKETYHTDETVEADRKTKLQLDCNLKADVKALVQKSSEAVDSERVSTTEALKRAICRCLEVREGGTWPATSGAASRVEETCCPGPPDDFGARLPDRNPVRPPAAASPASGVAGRPWPCPAGAGVPPDPGVLARPPRAVVWCARSTQALGDREHRALLDGMGAEARRLESISFESVSKLDRWLCTQERGADVVPWAALVVGWREANAAFDLVEAVATGCTGRLRPDCRRNLRPITGWPGSWEVNTAVSSVIVLAEGQQQCERAAAKITQRVFCSGSSHEQQQDPVSSSAWKLQVGANMGFPQLCTVEVLLAHDLVGLRAALRTVARA